MSLALERRPVNQVLSPIRLLKRRACDRAPVTFESCRAHSTRRPFRLTMPNPHRYAEHRAVHSGRVSSSRAENPQPLLLRPGVINTRARSPLGSRVGVLMNEDRRAWCAL